MTMTGTVIPLCYVGGVDRFDWLGLIGLLLMCYGIFLVYPPAAAIAAGGILMSVAGLGARAKKLREVDIKEGSADGGAEV